MTRSVAAGLATYSADADLAAAKSRLGAAMPDDGWLAEYLRAVTPLTDAPVEFHLVSGLCALAAAAGNRLYTESWGQNVFPHLWAVLVAPSSFWRKSTAIGQAERILAAVGKPEGQPTGLAFPSDFSRERLIKLLADQPSGFMSQKEFGGFLSLLGREYMSGSKEMLTDLYDGPEVYVRALQKEVVEVKRPALTLLGATTLDWLESKITEGDLRGGFLARFLFVTARQKASPKGMTETSQETRDARARLAIFLRDTAQLEAKEIVFEPAARIALDDWTLGWEEEVSRTRHRSDLSGFAVRLQTYALKFSMLYRLSAQYGRKSDTLAVIDEASVDAAITYCRALWSSVTSLIDDQIATTRDARSLRQILGIVGSGATQSEALKLSKLQAKDFNALVETLIQSGQVYRSKVHRSDVGIKGEGGRDTQVTWLSPSRPASANGSGNGSYGSVGVPSSSPLEVPSSSLEFQGEPEEEGNSRELQGPDLNSESPSSSPLTLHHPVGNARDSGRGGTRARTRAREGGTDQPVVEESSSVADDDEFVLP